jgi:flagellin
MGVWNLGDRSFTNVGAAGSTKLTGNMVAHVDISTRTKANDSIRVLDAAINQVSGTRADLGAMQNRLEHTINNLGVAKENLQSAESSIRDVDMAKEMMEFTKNNILTQASQSMLAQANQLPSGVLQLLQ